MTVKHMCGVNTERASSGVHPQFLFSPSDVPAIRARTADPRMAQVVARLFERAEYYLTAEVLRPSQVQEGEPVEPGRHHALGSARMLHGRVLTHCMAYTLSGDRKYRDAAVGELERAVTAWPNWVYNKHSRPFDLMTGELCMTLGLAYDWLHDDLTPAERHCLREGAIRRGLMAFIGASQRGTELWWWGCDYNWNPICFGGAAVLALALRSETECAGSILDMCVENLRIYWSRMPADGGSVEGTSYWAYGNRYGFLAAEALRRAGYPMGREVFELPAVRRTGYFPMVFNPGLKLAASFGDAPGRASDPLFYLLGQEYRNPDFIWFQDRAPIREAKSEGYPVEALTLLWRPVNESWLPDTHPGFTPRLEPVQAYPSIGWGLFTPKQPDPPYFLAFKNGSLGVTHTHLDLNTLAIAVGDVFVIPDLGNRPYTRDYFGPNRNQYYEISTRGHNTVLIGGRGQVQGRDGQLLGVTVRDGIETMTGIADGAYEVETTRVRRVVAFVRRRFWVVLDEVVTPAAQPVELRFHSYGVIRPDGEARWAFEQDGMAVDLVTATPGLIGSVENPEGWIRPVNVLSLKSQASACGHVYLTVFYPRATGEAPCPEVSAQPTPAGLRLTVGDEQIDFSHEGEGWAVGCRNL